MDFTGPMRYLKVGSIDLKEEDDSFCGGGDDRIDINPARGVESFGIYVDYHRNVYKRKADQSFERIGTANGRPITIRGDINPANPPDGMEVAEIQFTLRDLIMK